MGHGPADMNISSCEETVNITGVALEPRVNGATISEVGDLAKVGVGILKLLCQEQLIIGMIISLAGTMT